MGIKQIKKSTLYLRGMRATGRIEGIKRSSSLLKSIALDRVCFEECDEILDWTLVDLAVQRLGHSKVREEAYISTPSIPGWG
ncbi:MAG: hypothetical protein GTN76_09445, partial [Candidatus Aenigmarchaeota archaeon]|nr:hypothetical protein [Candidatus Aenigmarchaeota archaeon]